MTVFIEARTEPFVVQRAAMAERFSSAFRTEGNVRRPTRGHVLKEESFAILRVMGADGEFIRVIDAAGEELREDGVAHTTFYSNFFVQTVVQERAEKQQIVDTFGETYIFFFGESPRFAQVQGMLLNTSDFNWRDEFWANYDEHFRGTKLVERGARLYLIYDNVVIEGYMIRASATQSAQNPWVIPFNFQMFVTGETMISNIGDPTVQGAAEESVYGGSNSAGYYDSGIQQWVASSDADRGLASEALGLAASSGGPGEGRLLTDSIREGLVDAGDPATSSYTFGLASAMGDVDRIEFRPNPKTPSGRFISNTDEFVQMASPTAPGSGLLPLEDNWGLSATVIDGGVMSSVVPDDVGRSVSTTDSDYVDTMGRGGHATREITSSGGSRSVGEGIRRDLGGSDLPDTGANRARAAAPQRDTPFGMTAQPGSLA